MLGSVIGFCLSRNICGLTFDEMHGKLYLPGIGGRLEQPASNEVDCFTGNFATVDANGRQPWRREFRKWQVVETDHRNILGNAQSKFLNCTERTESNRIV